MLALTACSIPRVVTRTKTMNVPVIQPRTVPPPYLAATPVPPRPPRACLSDGAPRYCNRQLVDLLDAAEHALGECNADKAAGRLWSEGARDVSP